MWRGIYHYTIAAPHARFVLLIYINLYSSKPWLPRVGMMTLIFQSSPTRHSVGAPTETEEDWDMDNDDDDDDDDDQDRTLTTPRPPLTTNPQSPTTSVFSTDFSTPTPPLHREPRRLRKRSRPLAQLPDDTNTPQQVHERPTPSPQPPPDSSGFLSSGIGSVKRWSSRRKNKTSMPSDVIKDQGAQGGWSCLFRSF